uniref:Oxygen-evolving enhancer protein n=1 Tax=Neorhodella cyanea TaxID=131155 RepID=E5RPB5_9RHOD|nr:oxygen-evolving enhancer protein [Neorhodella cyanea]
MYSAFVSSTPLGASTSSFIASAPRQAAPVVTHNTQVVPTASLADRAREDFARLQKLVSSENVKRAALGFVAAAALATSAVPVDQAQALTTSDIRGLSYDQVKGTGLANRCPEVDSSKGTIKLENNKKYKTVDMCIEPKSFQVEEEIFNKRKGSAVTEYVDTKLMTRATYTLTGIEGPLTSDSTGLTFVEKDGIDYAATTVQLPGGERVPFLFTVKELVAKGNTPGMISTATEFGGDFRVPSYRTGLFLDPKGRGGVTGYDMAVALPGKEADGGEGQDDIFKETNKVFQITDGSIEMAVNKIDVETKEFAGVFVSEQLSDTDMGAKTPKKVLLKGVFYGRLAEDFN